MHVELTNDQNTLHGALDVAHYTCERKRCVIDSFLGSREEYTECYPLHQYSLNNQCHLCDQLLIC
jgi:hypothetical protein